MDGAVTTPSAMMREDKAKSLTEKDADDKETSIDAVEDSVPVAEEDVA
jgi:hypothetical protein